MGKWVRVGAVTPDQTRRIVTEMLQSPQRPTAIIASDSMIALEAFKVHRQLGLTIPDDVSLVSFTMRTGHR